MVLNQSRAVCNQSDLLEVCNNAAAAHSAWTMISRKWGTDNKHGVSGAVCDHISRLLEMGTKYAHDLSTYLASNCHNAIVSSARAMKAIYDAANLCNGGHPTDENTHWSEGLSDNPTLEQIVKHAERTLLRADGEKIANFSKELKQDCRSIPIAALPIQSRFHIIAKTKV